MKSALHIAILSAAWIVLTQWMAAPVAGTGTGNQNTLIAPNPAPTAGEVQSLVARVVENQHRDDLALEEFERFEHTISRRSDENSPVLMDRTDRVMPSGTGVMRLRVAQDGSPVSQELYRRELEFAVRALELAIHPNDRERQDLAKLERRRRDRAELVDAAAKALNPTWAGRETRGSRTLVKILLDPNPDYKPTSRLTAIYEHVHAVLWIDESQAQMARIEGDIASDITFGGGIVGKVYHGGHFVMDQSEVAPGVWLPTLYTSDVDGRKFLFAFGLHEHTEVTRYRHVGPPAQFLEIVRNELNSPVADIPVQ